MKLLLIDKSCLLLINKLIRRQSTIKQTDTHNPHEIETKWYEVWQKKLKQAECDKTRPYFSIILPPPNVTGTLHLGHALTLTIQDTIVRWKLMSGYRTVWIPGVDHAGIATQVIVERKLWSDHKQTRYDLGKEKFVHAVDEWKNDKTNEIKNQIIKLNALLNWNREYFTMNEQVTSCVKHAFINLFERGLVTRALRPVNWCCALKSTISDIEINSLEIREPMFIQVPNYKPKVELGYIHLFSYPVCDSSNNNNECITVATTRPETMFGDVCVAVNPCDVRYAHLKEKCVLNPLTNEKIPIVFDEKIDSTFETGAVKITPAHDFNDYELAKRHALEHKRIFDDAGHLINVPNDYLNKNRFEAREHVIKQLDSLGLYKAKKVHSMHIPLCSRTGDILEPMLKEQWFLRTKEMFEECGNVVRSGALELMPKTKTSSWYEYTTKYTRDWCISRQLWWGQQIPAYKATATTTTTTHANTHIKWFVAMSKREALEKAKEYFSNSDKIELEQDEDVFDTWFSSALLPLAVFNWPHTTVNDFNQMYPTNLLETGHDIMFFWVLRMVALCNSLSNRLPFKQVLFHALVLDSLGRKMSKSIGNVIDPMNLIEGASLEKLQQAILSSSLDEKEKKQSLKNQKSTYPHGLLPVGSDALRLGLLIQDFKSDSIKIDINLFLNNKHYCNKIWQASRYIELFNRDISYNHKSLLLDQLLKEKNLRLLDKWILQRLLHTIKLTNEYFNTYDLYLIVNTLRSFFYQDFCDFYVECSKLAKSNTLVCNILNLCLEQTLLMYHPFMPSVTEELWHRMNYTFDKESILDFKYPTIDNINNDYHDDDDDDIHNTNEMIQACQNIVKNVSSIKKTFQLNEKPLCMLFFIQMNFLCYIQVSSLLIQVYITCSNDFLTQSLQELKQEILYLSKSNDITFVNDLTSFNTNNGRIFQFEITNNCHLSVLFTQHINVEIEFKRIDEKIMKLNRDLNKLNDKLLNVTINNEKKKMFEEKMNEHKESIENLMQQKKILLNSK